MEGAEEHKATTIGQGDIVSQSFYPCIGENCAVLHVGKCLRLVEVLMKSKEIAKEETDV